MKQPHTEKEALKAVEFAMLLGIPVQVSNKPSGHLTSSSNIRLNKQMTPTDVCHEVQRKVKLKGRSIYEGLFEKIENLVY